MNKFNFSVLQHGQIGLKPDGTKKSWLEHRCTSVLIWPEDSTPSCENSVVTDPCFIGSGIKDAEAILEFLGLDFETIFEVFITHRHFDHGINLPRSQDDREFDYFQPGKNPTLAGIKTIPCPGHSRDLKALAFHSNTGQAVWIVGDAIIDREWLLDWKYYWPNGYRRNEIIQTWRSVGKIIASCGVIVPGHGSPFAVTYSLVEKLLLNFPSARHFDECDDILHLLEERLFQLKGNKEKTKKKK
ncbi:hypothetical protein ACFL35_02045 [Candidatus Riflebacteria bacterium]